MSFSSSNLPTTKSVLQRHHALAQNLSLIPYFLYYLCPNLLGIDGGGKVELLEMT